MTPGSPRAAASTTSVTRADSVAVDLRNLRRAGTLKKSSRTSTTVPAAQPAGDTTGAAPPSTRTRVPSASPLRRVRSSSRLTEAMLGSASPRKPKERMAARSSSLAILLVAWRTTERRASSAVHAGAVVGDAGELDAAGLDVDADAAGAGVERVFQQLFHDARGALDDFPRGDLVGEVLREEADRGHGSSGLSVARATASK